MCGLDVLMISASLGNVSPVGMALSGRNTSTLNTCLVLNGMSCSPSLRTECHPFVRLSRAPCATWILSLRSLNDRRSRKVMSGMIDTVSFSMEPE